MRISKHTALAVVFALAGVAILPAQTDDSISTDESDLFGSSDDVFGGDQLVTDVEQTDTDIASSLLTSDTVDIGGRYSMSLTAASGWNDITTVPENLFSPDSSSLSTSLSSQLYFDARPDENFRVFGKMTASYPFETRAGDPADPTDNPRDLQDVFHVEELFSDFNWNDTIFFRGGKQTMNWGVGYFYSLADLLSISEIDPEDPDAEREGPVALKANLPIGVDNLYAYVIPSHAAEPRDIGVALKGDLVTGIGEFTAGAIYQRDIAPAAMLTASGSLRQVDLFAEGVASYGSNRTFVRETALPPGVETYTTTDEFFFSATAGLSWSHSFSESDSSVMIVAQYLYNGEGYADASVLRDNQTAVYGLIAAGELNQSDIVSSGRHYSASSVTWSDMFGSKITGGLFWMQNYSDLSALITPSLSTTVLDAVQISLRTPIQFGDTGDEFSPTGNAMSIELSVSPGGGSF